MELAISELIEYAVRRGWLTDADRVWAANRLLEALSLDGFEGLCPTPETLPPLHEILETLCRDAAARGVIAGDTPTFTDLLDTKLMGLLLPRPSEVALRFWELYAEAPEAATDWYYDFSRDSNYIRRDRIARDQKWTVDTDYGTLDITVNLSKPEKDPRAIAAAGRAQAVGYPKCLLCVENEGYAGRLDHPARQNHRILPVRLAGGDYFLQYSPYVYYNEHCIVLNRTHVPMRIDRMTFDNLLDFVTLFPHYFIGSNADLPIVGGSVLSHDHYQGGRYEFPMARAAVEEPFAVPGFADVECGIVRWPMSVLRLRGADRERLSTLAEHVLDRWRVYDDPAAGILHETEGTPHNTVTPIARRRGSDYELDLVLRNNRTTPEHPLGLFHPHAERHHIKKENIGLIEVMGLAVLPARLKTELAAVAEALVREKDLDADPLTASHASWAREVRSAHPEMDADKAAAILRQAVGEVFCGVLEDAGVYKRDPAGRRALHRFLETL
ncbi:MAG: UDP-glucose--hexose-1-phosphate uridylyltransferase [Oscillospiraceae bacterium]|nr:UDP-glucose--hexose-1-phosphate uridylyltransferase [Oscillospiraceae bacterium]